jgi:hypothetical protein
MTTARRAGAWRVFAAVAVVGLILAAVAAYEGRHFARRVARKLRRWTGSHGLASSPAPAPVPLPDAPVPTAAAHPEDIVEMVYDASLRNGWNDYGWATRELGKGPAKVNFSNFGGWIIAKPALDASFGALVLRVKLAPGEADYLDVHVESASENGFPHVKIGHAHALHLSGVLEGWDEVQIPMDLLDPDGARFDRIVFFTHGKGSDDWTLLDGVGFTRAAPAANRLDPATYASHEKTASLRVRCDAPATPISPFIYGIAYDFQNDSNAYQWQIGATIRRWGGNCATRYNWQIHAWNLDSDWFFENVSVLPYTTFLTGNAEHHVASALTVPMMGWVAKDTTSASFPVDAFGPQGSTDPWHPKNGNGTRDGKPIAAGPPTRTSVAITPEFVRQWVEKIRADDARTGRRSVDQYILDNEPGIWHLTHRDAHPEPLSYDELVDKTIRFGTAVRQADPQATIAGPAEYGWLGYLYSGKDTENDWAKADRKAHGDVPFVEWYLRKLREYEEKTGIRVLDVLDLHYYPSQPEGPPSGVVEAAARRIRSTRSLWDPGYEDESWIHEKIRLLPRMREWVDKNYPGRGISIGEWNFYGPDHPSGALAAAEALGRFAQFGVTSAFFWTFPAKNALTAQGFLAYRNFDGKGGRFLDYFVPVDASGPVSFFASRDSEGKHMVLVAINASPDEAVMAKLDLSTCGTPTSAAAFGYVKGSSAIAAFPTAPESSAGTTAQLLPPYSITVVDLRFAEPVGAPAAR